MTGSTDARYDVTSRLRCSRAIALLAVVLTASPLACATGAMRNVGRRIERPLAFESAYTDGARLWLTYRSETRNAWNGVVASPRRTVSVAIDDLDPRRQYTVDEFPLQRLSPSEIPLERLRPLELRETTSARAEGMPQLLISMRDGRPQSVRPTQLAGASPDAVFHTDALVHHGVAPWTYAALPATAAWDAVAVPAFSIFALPFFVWSK